MSEPTEQHPFITYLESKREDRAIMAALRRGLGQPPGSAPPMFPYVVPFLHDNMYAWQEESHYIVASLFGFYPESTVHGNMGTHFATLQRENPASAAVERRFVALMAAHPEDLDFHLRQAISLLKSKEVPVNWHRLMRDVLRWNNPDARARVHRQWAAEFWRQSPVVSPDETIEADDSSDDF
ncbi:MAG TPA: type I-E CRISPR-associated protein Cse2/CasB [Aggregatilineaceae bacterium]|jgi:CRISPR system Cascade subunit CasB|nr:type I-E CRISPR-associated protein Cse2/CasB [Aggregatilineaceae bacterium]